MFLPYGTLISKKVCNELVSDDFDHDETLMDRLIYNKLVNNESVNNEEVQRDTVTNEYACEFDRVIECNDIVVYERKIHTGADNALTFDNLEPGTYTVTISGWYCTYY